MAMDDERMLLERKKAALARRRRRKRQQRRIRLLLALVIVLIILVAILFFTVFRHRHTPGPEATCTEPQICTDCGEILVKAHGHTPGPEATCTEPQTCEVCGTVLAKALGHDPGDSPLCQPGVCTRCGLEIAATENHQVDANGVCTVCGNQILPAGTTVHAAGAESASGDDTASLIPETQPGHYNASGDGHYAGSVMICGDYGLEYFNPKPEGSKSWATAINKFSEKYPELNVTAMIVPKATAYHTAANYEDPHNAIATYIENTYALLNDSIRHADAMGTMDDHADEYMFYRTDHHWTSLGAYYASTAYCEANDIAPRPLDSFETITKTGFIGTLYNYGGKPAALKDNPDYTVFHFPHTAYAMQYYNGSGWVDGKAFNTSTPSYASAYIMGDQSVELFTTANSNDKTLMIFKESYGNCFAPYMIDYYSKVIVVDIRKTDLSVQDLIAQHNVTDVLFINNCQAVSSLSDSMASRCMN